MRTTFVNELMKLAEKDERIVLITGDMGFSMFEKFKEKFPDRYYNAGIAEQNMVGMAAGLALRGKKPYVYSIIPFLIMRSYEQVRVDVCYHELDVKFIGSGGGVSYGHLGATHHATEDINLMRGLPNIEIIAPGDPYEAKNAVDKSYLNKKPTYIRLSKNKDPFLHKNLKDEDFEIGKAICMKKSGNIAIISTSNMLNQAVEVSNELDNLGIKNSLYSFHTIKPMDKETLDKIFKNYKYIVTMEEHNVIGGLYGAIMEEYGKGVINDYSIEKVLPIAINDKFSHHVGDQNNIRKYFGIDKDSVINKIKEILK
jgi:transketolase